MAPEPDDGDRLPSISEAIEGVGFGPAQLLAGLLGGSSYLVAGVTLTLVAAGWLVGQPDGGVTYDRASLMSAIMFGECLGNSISGPVGDKFGRRGVILASRFLSLISAILCLYAESFMMLCVCRLLLGFSLGIGVPPWLVLCTEITPAAWRVALNAYSQGLFVLGEMYGGLFILWSDDTMENLDWRSLTPAGLLPGIVLGVFAYLFLVQSPAYLATKGEHEQAREVIEVMARQNCAAAVPGTLRQDAVAVDSAGSNDNVYQALFGQRMWFSTMAVAYSCFVCNLVYYGVLYGLPQVVQNVETGTSPAMSVLLGALWEFPGLTAGALVGTWIRRLPVIVGTAVGLSCALACFGIGVSVNDMWYGLYMIQGALMCIKILCNVAFVVLYQYASEIYPVAARTTGSAICVSGGRIGAIVAPVIFEHIHDYTGSFSGFFFVAAGFAAINGFLSLFLTIETAGMVDLNESHSQDHRECQQLLEEGDDEKEDGEDGEEEDEDEEEEEEEEEDESGASGKCIIC